MFLFAFTARRRASSFHAAQVSSFRCHALFAHGLPFGESAEVLCRHEWKRPWLLPGAIRPLSLEQDADDVAALLKQLHIEKADFMGLSNGGTTCLQIAIRHPRLVRKLVLASATYKRDSHAAGLF